MRFFSFQTMIDSLGLYSYQLNMFAQEFIFKNVTELKSFLEGKARSRGMGSED